MSFSFLSNPNRIIQWTRKTVDEYLDNLENRLFPDRCVLDVEQRPKHVTPKTWYIQYLANAGLDWEQEKHRGIFYYLDEKLPDRNLYPYKPLRITFIQAGPATIELSAGSKFLPQELFSFVPSVLSSASSILGAIRADAAMNFDVEHLFMRAHSDEFEPLTEHEINHIATHSDVVLLGCQSSTWKRGKEIILSLRECNPHLILIAGGPQPTIDPDYVVEAGVDYVVRYDGCVSACGLIRAIAGGLSNRDLEAYLERIPNLFYRHSLNGYQTTAKMEMCKEAGAPYPPILANDFYTKQFREKIRLLSSGASIGCPYKCAMCNSSRISSLSRRPVQHVIADLRRLYQLGELESKTEVEFEHLKELFCVILGQVAHKVLDRNATQYFQREIFFWDDNLTSTQNRAYAIELFQAMADFFEEAGVAPPFITLQVGIDFFNDEMLIKAARRAGIRRVCCGFEHISENALKYIEKKKINFKNIRQQYRDAVSLAHRNDIAVHGYLMVGFDEKESEIEAIAQFFRDISVCTIQVLFAAPWKKKWIAQDIPDVEQQPQFDLEKLNQKGMIPSYLYDSKGELIQALMTGGLVPLCRAQNIDYKRLFFLRRKIYQEFYTFESILDVIKNRDSYPDWAYTAIIRYQTWSVYTRTLDSFYHKFELDRKLREADRDYKRHILNQKKTEREADILVSSSDSHQIETA